MPEPTAHADLLHFNVQLLDQAATIVAAHLAPGGPSYPGPVGAHLRHVIEHYEALLLPPSPGIVDYDSRPRDALLERSAAVADCRLRALRSGLVARSRVGPMAHSPAPEAAAEDRPLQVRGRFGPCGESVFSVPSTLERELAFLASHTVHHFALLRPHLQRCAITLGEHFGKAPATVAHALVATSPRSSTPLKEPACQPLSASLS